MPFGPDSILNPWWAILLTGVYSYFAARLLERLIVNINIWKAVLIVIFPFVYLIGLGIVWGGDMVLWKDGKRALWAGLHEGLIFQIYEVGPADWCGVKCRGEIIPHLGGLSLDWSQLGPLLVLVVMYGVHRFMTSRH